MGSHKHVLLALGWYDHRLLEGIAAYATEHRWHLAARSILHEKVIPWGWKGDGILAWLGAGDDLAQFVVSAGVPTVDFSMRRPQWPFGRVIQDHGRTGRLVAEHFLERGLRRFAFYRDSANWSQVERGRGFEEALREKGLRSELWCWEGGETFRVVGEAGEDEWTRRRRWLSECLAGGSKPIGVFAANGVLAVELQEVCAAAGWAVPEEISIVGMEDYLLSVGAQNRSISGVDTHLAEQGYQGAALLDRLMQGEPVPACPIRIAPIGVVVRQSSDGLAVNHRGVARGLRYIAEHFREPMTVVDVAREAGMSERGVHQAFCEWIGMGPGEKIRRVRLEHAKRRLAGTEEKIEAVALGSGFASLNSFFVAFRNLEGQTPGEYRRWLRRALGGGPG
jgi:LacI family transcriptional regulator